MKWLTYLFPGIYDRPPPSRPLRSNVGGSLLMMVGFQAGFALLCAIYTTISKRAVLSVVRRCSWSLILYVYAYHDRMLDLLVIICIYELVNIYSRSKKDVVMPQKTYSQDLYTRKKTTSNKYLELCSQRLKLCLDCEDLLERFFYFSLLCSFANEEIWKRPGNDTNLPLSKVKVSVVIAGILLLSCILDFVFWLTSSKHATVRLLHHCLAMVRKRCLLAMGIINSVEYYFFPIISLEDVSLEAKSLEDRVYENRSFDQRIRVLNLYNLYQTEVNYSILVLGVLYVAVWFVLPLCIHLKYWLDMLYYGLYCFGSMSWCEV